MAHFATLIAPTFKEGFIVWSDSDCDSNKNRNFDEERIYQVNIINQNVIM